MKQSARALDRLETLRDRRSYLERRIAEADEERVRLQLNHRRSGSPVRQQIFTSSLKR